MWSVNLWRNPRRKKGNMKVHYIVEGRCMKPREFARLRDARRDLKKKQNLYNIGDIYIVKVVKGVRIVI
jgi:hypothetical protein